MPETAIFKAVKMTPLWFSVLVVLGISCAVAVEVSVCQDATYDISVDATALCSGAGSKPAGWSCPKAGDVAVTDCLSTLASFRSGSCVAPEDAVCDLVSGDTWGCVLPSIGCNDALTEAVGESSCETWDYSGDVSVDSSGSFDGNEDYDESWFKKTTKLRELFDCGNAPTPAPTTATPEATPAATKTNATETPIQTTTSAVSDTYETKTEPIPAATKDNVAESETEGLLPPSLNSTSMLTPKPALTSILVPTQCNGSSSDEPGAESKAGYKTAVGDEDSRAKNSMKVTFAAADPVNFGKLSDETLAGIAAAVAFAAVVVAAIAVAYARKRRHVEEEGEQEEEEKEEIDDGDEKDKDVETDSPESSLLAPSTPVEHLATTPVEHLATTPVEHLATRTLIGAETCTPKNSVTTTSSDSSSEKINGASDDHAGHENADTASLPGA